MKSESSSMYKKGNPVAVVLYGLIMNDRLS